MEARESGAEVKALTLVSEYIKKFRFINFTLHPRDILGEAAGKGSNVSWASRKMSKRYLAAQRKDVISTSIDGKNYARDNRKYANRYLFTADSHLSSNYFTLITTMHLLYPERANKTLYSAPIIFDRNAHLVPALVRVADILWCAAGLSGLYNGSSISPPTSVYSVSLELADRVGGWHVDLEAIADDLHMYLKCFFALNGNLTTRSVFSPASHSNVHSNGKGVRGFYNDIMARYKQALRHMWGALDSGFVLRSAINMWWRKRKNANKYVILQQTLFQQLTSLGHAGSPCSSFSTECTKRISSQYISPSSSSAADYTHSPPLPTKSPDFFSKH